MDMVYHWLSVILFALASFFISCFGAPITDDLVDISSTISVPGYIIIIVSSAAIILVSYLVIGCVCCPNKSIKALTYQNGFPVNRLNENNSLQFENPSEFAIFPPHSAVIDLQPVGLPFPTLSEDKVTFEPLPDILPRRLSGQSAACSSRPAHFRALLKNKVSLHDWFDDPNSNFPRDQLQYLRELGCGWFGQVVEGEAAHICSTEDKTLVVVKILREEASPSDHLHFLHEARPYRDISHPNIIRLLGRCLESDPFLLLMEHSTSDLKSYLNQQENRDNFVQNGLLLQMACNVASGLKCLHDNGFTHSDFAARNCFVYPDFTVKIGDYGTSFDHCREDYYCLGDTALPIRWCSPETLVCTDSTIETKEITKEANVWAFGVVLWEIFEFGKLPYENLTNEEVLQKIVIERIVQLPSLSLDLLNKEELSLIMKECWKVSKLRPPMSKIEQFLTRMYNDRHNLKTLETSFEERWNSMQPKIKEVKSSSISDPSSLKFENDFSERSDSHNLSYDGERFSSFEMSFDMFSKNISSQLSPSLRVLNGSMDELTENDVCLNSVSLGGERSTIDASSFASVDDLPQLEEESVCDRIPDSAKLDFQPVNRQLQYQQSNNNEIVIRNEGASFYFANNTPVKLLPNNCENSSSKFLDDNSNELPQTVDVCNVEDVMQVVDKGASNSGKIQLSGEISTSVADSETSVNILPEKEPVTIVDNGNIINQNTISSPCPVPNIVIQETPAGVYFQDQNENIPEEISGCPKPFRFVFKDVDDQVSIFVSPVPNIIIQESPAVVDSLQDEKETIPDIVVNERKSSNEASRPFRFIFKEEIDDQTVSTFVSPIPNIVIQESPSIVESLQDEKENIAKVISERKSSNEVSKPFRFIFKEELDDQTVSTSISPIPNIVIQESPSIIDSLQDEKEIIPDVVVNERKSSNEASKAFRFVFKEELDDQTISTFVSPIPNIVIQESPSVVESLQDEKENIPDVSENKSSNEASKPFRFVFKDELVDQTVSTFVSSTSGSQGTPSSQETSNLKFRSQPLTSTPLKGSQDMDLNYSTDVSSFLENKDDSGNVFYSNFITEPNDGDEASKSFSTTSSEMIRKTNVDAFSSFNDIWNTPREIDSETYNKLNCSIADYESGWSCDPNQYTTANSTFNVNSNTVSKTTQPEESLSILTNSLLNSSTSKNEQESNENSRNTYVLAADENECDFLSSPMGETSLDEDDKCPKMENHFNSDAFPDNSTAQKSPAFQELSVDFGESVTPDVSFNISSFSYEHEGKSSSSPGLLSDNIKDTESDLDSSYSKDINQDGHATLNQLQSLNVTYDSHKNVTHNFESEASGSEFIDSYSPDFTSNSFADENRMEAAGNMRVRRSDNSSNYLNLPSESKTDLFYSEDDLDDDSESDTNAYKSKGELCMRPYDELIVEDLETGEQTIITESFSACDDYENSAESDDILKINTETDEAIIVDSSQALIGFVPSRSIEMLNECEVIATMNPTFGMDDEKEFSDLNNYDPSHSPSSSPGGIQSNESPCGSPDTTYPLHQPYRNFNLQNEIIEEEVTGEIATPSSERSTSSFSSNEVYMGEDKMSQSSESNRQDVSETSPQSSVSYRLEDLCETSVLPSMDHLYGISDDDCSPIRVDQNGIGNNNASFLKDFENNHLTKDDVMYSRQPMQAVRWHSDDTLDVERDSPIILEGREILAGEILETKGMTVEAITTALNRLEVEDRLNRKSFDRLGVSQTPSPYSSLESSPCREAYTPDFESDSGSGTSCSSTSGSFECIHNKFKDTADITRLSDGSDSSNDNSREQSPMKIFSKTWDCHATPTKGVLLTPEKKFHSLRKSVSFHNEDPQVVFEYPPASDSSEDGGGNDGVVSWDIDYRNYADWELQAGETEEIDEILEIEELDSEPYVRRPNSHLSFSQTPLNRPMMYSLTTEFSDDDMDFSEPLNSKSTVPSNSPEEGKQSVITDDQIGDLIRSQLNNLALEESRLMRVKDVIESQTSDLVKHSSVIPVQDEMLDQNMEHLLPVNKEIIDVEKEKFDANVEKIFTNKDVESLIYDSQVEIKSEDLKSSQMSYVLVKDLEIDKSKDINLNTFTIKTVEARSKPSLNDLDFEIPDNKISLDESKIGFQISNNSILCMDVKDDTFLKSSCASSDTEYKNASSISDFGQEKGILAIEHFEVEDFNSKSAVKTCDISENSSLVDIEPSHVSESETSSDRNIQTNSLTLDLCEANMENDSQRMIEVKKKVLPLALEDGNTGLASEVPYQETSAILTVANSIIPENLSNHFFKNDVECESIGEKVTECFLNSTEVEEISQKPTVVTETAATFEKPVTEIVPETFVPLEEIFSIDPEVSTSTLEKTSLITLETSVIPQEKSSAIVPDTAAMLQEEETIVVPESSAHTLDLDMTFAIPLSAPETYAISPENATVMAQESFAPPTLVIAKESSAICLEKTNATASDVTAILTKTSNTPDPPNIGPDVSAQETASKKLKAFEMTMDGCDLDPLSVMMLENNLVNKLECFTPAVDLSVKPNETNKERKTNDFVTKNYPYDNSNIDDEELKTIYSSIQETFTDRPSFDDLPVDSIANCLVDCNIKSEKENILSLDYHKKLRRDSPVPVSSETLNENHNLQDQEPTGSVGDTSSQINGGEAFFNDSSFSFQPVDKQQVSNPSLVNVNNMGQISKQLENEEMDVNQFESTIAAEMPFQVSYSTICNGHAGSKLDHSKSDISHNGNQNYVDGNTEMMSSHDESALKNVQDIVCSGAKPKIKTKSKESSSHPPEIIVTPASESDIEDELEEYLRNQLRFVHTPEATSGDFSVSPHFSYGPFEDIYNNTGTSREYTEAFNFEFESGEFFDDVLDSCQNVEAKGWESSNLPMIEKSSGDDDDFFEKVDSSPLYLATKDTTHL